MQQGGRRSTSAESSRSRDDLARRLNMRVQSMAFQFATHPAWMGIWRARLSSAFSDDRHRPSDRRTEVQMKAAGQTESEGREDFGGRLRCPSMPTSLALKRRVGRPSTPKGVGRCALLTATRHDTEEAAMSADWTSGRASGVDCGVDGAMDRAFTPVLALRCGCGDLVRWGTGTGADAGWWQYGGKVDTGDGVCGKREVGGDGAGSKCGDASSRSQIGKTAQERGQEQ
jgi:hypothetical protein